MCDPMVGMALSIASAGLGYMQQQDMANKQQQANNEWIAYQRQKSQEEWARQEEYRQKAETARQESVVDIAPDKQKEAQGKEETRLMNELAPEQTPEQQAALVGDRMLSGQQGASAQVKETFANQLNQASKDARARIQSLATLSSYGGTQFGLQNRAKEILNKSGQVIGLQGNIRSGSLSAHQAEKAVPVAQVRQGGGSSFAGIGNALAGISGRGVGSSLAGGPPSS
jgi:hypothetical protein